MSIRSFPTTLVLRVGHRRTTATFASESDSPVRVLSFHNPPMMPLTQLCRRTPLHLSNQFFTTLDTHFLPLLYNALYSMTFPASFHLLCKVPASILSWQTSCSCHQLQVNHSLLDIFFSTLLSKISYSLSVFFISYHPCVASMKVCATWATIALP